VRELVYLSDRKLEQFLPTLRSLWPRPKINIKTPPIEVGLEPVSEADKKKLKHLARVIAHLEESARWFLDPGISPGEWAHFEAPLNYLVVESDDRELVFFVDRGKASADYPEGGTDRLILHCSSHHLLVENRPARVPAPSGGGLGLDPGASGPGIFGLDAMELLLSRLHDRPGPSDEDYRPLGSGIADNLSRAVNRLVQTIDRRVHPETAAWMAGYARITACCPAPTPGTRYIIASPLYIEYATPPRNLRP
jgi:Family of unknown function (DUF7019)